VATRIDVDAVAVRVDLDVVDREVVDTVARIAKCPAIRNETSRIRTLRHSLSDSALLPSRLFAWRVRPFHK